MDMLKQTITYVDFNGEDVTEDLYFHLNKAEVLNLTADVGGDLGEFAQQLAKSGNLKAMLNFIQDIIARSYGERSVDGKHFHKNDKIREDFENTQAFAELFARFIEHPEQVKDFAEGLITIPNNGQKSQLKAVPEQPKWTPAPAEQYEPKKQLSPEDLLNAMKNDPELFKQLLEAQKDSEVN